MRNDLFINTFRWKDGPHSAKKLLLMDFFTLLLHADQIYHLHILITAENSR